MATPQLSPGVITREIDLTTGAVGNVTGLTGAFAGPFAKGPVEEPILVASEAELLNRFGSGINTDRHYEYWLSASSFLSYGGDLLISRCDSPTLKNSCVGVSSATTVKIKNFDDYSLNYEDDPSLGFYYAAKEPGSWGDGLKVAVIDDYADLTIGIATTSFAGVSTATKVEAGKAIIKDLTSVIVPGIGVTSLFNGYLKGIITGVKENTNGTNSELYVKVISRVSYGVTSHNLISNPTVSIATTASETRIYLNSTTGIIVGDKFTGGALTRNGITSVGSTFIDISSGIGATVVAGASVTIERSVFTPGSETPISYSLNSPIASFNSGDTLLIKNFDQSTAQTLSASSSVDWYNQQTIQLSTGSIFWRTIAPKLQTNIYTSSRNGSNDAMHIAVFDDNGTVTGIQGNLVEKWTSLSKAQDAVSALNSPAKLYYKKLLATNSNYLYAGKDPSSAEDTLHGTKPSVTAFSSGFVPLSLADGVWGQNAQNTHFNVIGNKTYTLNNGFDYGTKNGMSVSLADLSTSYDIFEDTNRFVIDYLIQGPGLAFEQESQAKANKLISIAELRKDCVAVISPHRESVIDINNSSTQTSNVIQFYNQISSSSYAVFDSGYKLTFDRFSNSFKYIPCNPDVAGLMVRTTLNQYPWYSPAGLQRGALNNAIRLAYNPTKAQRDILYSARINPIINQPGSGIVLFGDKTALSYISAFDRINVRKLFLFVERSIDSLAQAQLFQFNDSITRSAFINLVEPFLRDIQVKRGLYDFLVRCDESNNTPDVIDNNEFRADIYLKPTRSINYVTITFIATRTGASFTEYTG